MYIGLGIVITVDIKYVNENALGLIVMIGGLLPIVFSLVVSDRYRRRRGADAAPVVQT